MTTDILNYLSEQSPEETQKIFNYVLRRGLNVQFKSELTSSVGLTQFVATEWHNKFNLLLKQNLELKKQILTFKIKIGTEVYFFKSSVRFQFNQYVIKGPFTLYKLVRRKTARFTIPDNWFQAGCILASQKKIQNSEIKIFDISESGMRFLIYPQLPKYEKGQTIQISFRIHKRATVIVSGLIQHLKTNKTEGPTVGVEFQFHSPLIQNKIQNICEDLALHLAQESSVKS